jgi:hypothetical protein
LCNAEIKHWQGFNAQRVESGIAKLKKARQGGAQLRMDSFFKAMPAAAPAGGAGAAAGGKVLGGKLLGGKLLGGKRKVEDEKKGTKKVRK